MPSPNPLGETNAFRVAAFATCNTLVETIQNRVGSYWNTFINAATGIIRNRNGVFVEIQLARPWAASAGSAWGVPAKAAVKQRPPDRPPAIPKMRDLFSWLEQMHGKIGHEHALTESAVDLLLTGQK